MSTENAAHGPHRIRASDTEREQVATILRAAMTEGRLTLPEGEERLTAAYAAAYRDELGPLTADLPDGGRRALADTPEAKAEVRRFVRGRIAAFALIIAGLAGIAVLTGAHFVWIPMFFLIMMVFRWRRFGRWHRYGGWRGPYGWHDDAPRRDRPGGW